METKMEAEEKSGSTKVILGVVVAAVILGVVVYAGYQYSQKAGGGEAFPPSYSQPVRNPVEEKKPEQKPEEPIIWQTYTNNVFKFTLSYPSSLKPRNFPGPKGEGGVFFDKDTKTNMLVSVDTEASRAADRKDWDTEKYVKGYWQMFTGLKGVKSVDKFTNAVNETGWKAVYINTLNQTPNTDVFFEAVDGTRNLVHFSKGGIDEKTFDQIIDTFKFIR